MSEGKPKQMSNGNNRSAVSEAYPPLSVLSPFAGIRALMKHKRERRVRQMPTTGVASGVDVNYEVPERSWKIISKCKCKCIQSFVERRLQDDQRPFTRVPGNTSYMQNTVSL